MLLHGLSMGSRQRSVRRIGCMWILALQGVKTNGLVLIITLSNKYTATFPVSIHTFYTPSPTKTLELLQFIHRIGLMIHKLNPNESSLVPPCQACRLCLSVYCMRSWPIFQFHISVHQGKQGVLQNLMYVSIVPVLACISVVQVVS